VPLKETGPVRGALERNDRLLERPDRRSNRARLRLRLSQVRPVFHGLVEGSSAAEKCGMARSSRPRLFQASAYCWRNVQRGGSVGSHHRPPLLRPKNAQEMQRIGVFGSASITACSSASACGSRRFVEQPHACRRRLLQGERRRSCLASGVGRDWIFVIHLHVAALFRMGDPIS